MSNPKGAAVDDRGNIYVADTMNMAIRKISESGMPITFIIVIIPDIPDILCINN